MASTSRVSSGKTLDEWAHDLADVFDAAARDAANEMEVREAVHQKVLDAAFDLYGREGFTTTAERRSGGGGRKYDRLYGGVVVEWEHHMGRARREHGAKQAVEYLEDIRRNRAEAFTAVVADGSQWGFLVADEGDDDADLFTEMPEAYADRFEWQANSPATCRKYLELLGAHRRTPVNARTLKAAFGPESDIAHRSVAVLLEALSARTVGDRSDTLYLEWRRALDVVYGDLDALEGTLVEAVEASYNVQVKGGVGEALFVLHSYFALVARLIAVELLAAAVQDPSGAPTSWNVLPDDQLLDRLSGMDQGDLPGGLSIDNLFETDTFSWWHGTAGNADLLDVLRRLLSALDLMSFPRIVYGPAPAGDVLRDLYQSLVPRQLRKALGEFLTPAWLAEGCLERLGTLGAPMNEGRVIDLTCGTGTFLVPLLNRRLRTLRAGETSPSAEDVQEVVNSVVGIDLNPVAVVAARVNYVVALGDLATAGNLSLPVYRADSLLIPQVTFGKGELGSDLAGLRFHELKTSLEVPFVVPGTLAHANLVGRLRQLLEGAIEDEDRDGKDPTHAFEAALDAEFGPGSTQQVTADAAAWADEVTVAKHLLGQIRALNAEARNHVWARIIENAFAPLFAGRFDVIVGNPPWLTWTKLPGPWRAESERIWRRYGLWKVPQEQGSAESLASTDLAVLVFAVALERYAKDDGWVGLLTPDSVITADPGGRAFRRFLLQSEHGYEGHTKVRLPFQVLHVDNWAEVKPFAPEAANRPIFVIARPGQAQAFPVPGSRWERSASGTRHFGAWAKVRAALTELTGHYQPINSAKQTSAWSFQRSDTPPLISGGSNDWSFGKGLDTRGANGVFFVRILRAHQARGTVDLVNIPSESKRPRPPEARGQVESQLVYPLLRGRDVRAWIAKPTSYMVLPHNPDNLGDVLADSEFVAKFKRTRDWLRRFFPRLKQRRTPPRRAWNMEGDDWCRVDGPLSHMAGRHIVVVREISDKPAAAVIKARMDFDLGRVASPLIDHKLLFCAVKSEEEALYLAAFINSTPVQDLLDSYINAVAVSPTTLSRLPIPAFDLTDPNVVRLVATARSIDQADDPTAEAALRQADLDAAVLALVGKDAEDHRAQPRKNRRAGSRPEPDAGERLF